MNDSEGTIAAINRPTLNPEEILDGIRQWVEVETPSHDGAAVNKLADHVERDFACNGAKIERVAGRGGFGDTLIARAPWGDGRPGILVVSHLDTVHPHGTLNAELAFRRDGDKVYGPGIYDMKGGAFLGFHAYRHLVRCSETTPLPVTFLYVPEEEIGSPISREIIEREALKAKYVLVTEPARDGGKIVTARKGAARFVMTATGRPAHSGVRHQDGRSAIREIAHQVLAVDAMTDYDRGLTTNVGLINGGTGVNVVPAACTVEIDVRMVDMPSGEAATAAILARQPVGEDVTLTVTGGINRPPYDKSPEIAALFEHARRLAADIGFDLEDVPRTGGGSDGNFTAALGIPTLDGLGVDGDGAHTLDEHLSFASLVPRTRLLLDLLKTLD